ncbi:hypothetical protein D9611_006465 [Ephemerocybe angulata]|uniref:Uncharacterized protein n=1 Tax=Ephemerocybe angulata TaxID=980116 RepID=A0A8H5C8E6_9AGAR|nr:hypothetical protein D9611_006465 [Tulosesus angulatus]
MAQKQPLSMGRSSVFNAELFPRIFRQQTWSSRPPNSSRSLPIYVLSHAMQVGKNGTAHSANLSVQIDKAPALRVLESKGLTAGRTAEDTLNRPLQSCTMAIPGRFPQDVIRHILQILVDLLQESDSVSVRFLEEVGTTVKSRCYTHTVLPQQGSPFPFLYLGLGPTYPALPWFSFETGRLIPHPGSAGASVSCPTSAQGPRVQLPLALLRFSSVCAYWRFTCHFAPSMFSHLVIQIPLARGKPSAAFAKGHYNLCQLFLSRLSSPGPLLLVIRAGEGPKQDNWRVVDTRTELAKLMVACNKERGRWKELEVVELGDRFMLQLLFGVEGADTEESLTILPSPDRTDTPLSVFSVPHSNPMPPAPCLERLILHIDRIIPQSRAMDRQEWSAIQEGMVLNLIRQFPRALPLLTYLQVDIDQVDKSFVEPFLASVANIYLPPSFPGSMKGEMGNLRSGEEAHDWNGGEAPYSRWHEKFTKDVRQRIPRVTDPPATSIASLWVIASKSRPDSEEEFNAPAGLPDVNWGIGGRGS